jgi:hypothetical protein
VATNLPLFELTLYKPYAEDATESTVLTPIGGAAHTDQFIVTTLQGISGAKPYLEQPSGRQGSLDPVTRKLSVGNLSVRVFDPRVTAGGSNAVRRPSSATLPAVRASRAASSGSVARSMARRRRSLRTSRGVSAM